MDHIQLICDIGELNAVFTDAQSIESFLQKIVEMVAKHMNAAVCSIYLYEEDKKGLTLRATYGLNKEFIGKIHLKLGEGLTGLALKEQRPITERIAKKHPNFKYFPGTTEEKYDAFLAVPILRALLKVGVLVVQRPKNRYFGEKDIVTLRAVASQLANMIENARLFMTMKISNSSEKKTTRQLKMQKGKVASEGYAYGPSRTIDRERTFENFRNREFKGNYTIKNFQDAIKNTACQLEDLQARVEEKLSDVASLIFTAHLLLLKDKEFVGSMIRKIEEGIPPPEAVIMVVQHYIEIFSQSQNAYIKEKVQDIEDLSIRLLSNLVREFKDQYLCENHIVIARELFPSDILKLSSENVLGIVLVTGGVTSHLSILARSLKIPILIVDSQKVLSISDETPVLLDAEVGNFLINPSQAIINNFNQRNENRRKFKSISAQTRPQTYTKDGIRVKLMASINLLSDLKLANDVQSEGIGLYRTEFPFLIRNDFPSEEEQYAVYRQLVEGMPDKEITFRTLDIGGDKILSYSNSAKEQNPFLGMRSIRFSLSNKELFIQQIRAMLRAGTGAKIKIMFPMISSLEEFLEAKMTVLECINQLKEKKIAHNSTPQIGIMVEVPSTILIMNELAAEADFFSIGTNDLVQYLLAVDRTNEKVAEYYVPHHPSVLRTIKNVVDVAKIKGKGVAICGDMAHNELYLPFFIGVGVNELSLEAFYIPKVQDAISQIDSVKATILVSELLKADKSSEVLRILK